MGRRRGVCGAVLCWRWWGGLFFALVGPSMAGCAGRRLAVRYVAWPTWLKWPEMCRVVMCRVVMCCPVPCCAVQDFKADVVLHFGMHGTVEWLPGAPLGNTGLSWSDVLLGEMPNV